MRESCSYFREKTDWIGFALASCTQRNCENNIHTIYTWLFWVVVLCVVSITRPVCALKIIIIIKQIICWLYTAVFPSAWPPNEGLWWINTITLAIHTGIPQPICIKWEQGYLFFTFFIMFFSPSLIISYMFYNPLFHLTASCRDCYQNHINTIGPHFVMESNQRRKNTFIILFLFLYHFPLIFLTPQWRSHPQYVHFYCNDVELMI